MPLQNRVTPDGEIVAIAARGLVMGNRGGAIHDDARCLTRRRWASRQWICCVLSFKGRRRQVMTPRRYTELFFLDEATALAAGHRPCFECRRADALAFATLWSAAKGLPERPSAPDMDRVLQAERLLPGGAKRTHVVPFASLPPAAFVRHGGAPHLVTPDRLFLWTPDGYGPPVLRPADGMAEMLTPPAIAAVLSAGYRPLLHPTAPALPLDG
jgi:hypothetical protein